MRHITIASMLVFSVCTLARAQSLKVEAPAHLSQGVNHAVCDSFTGDQFWDVWVNPGKFEIRFAGSNPAEGFSVGGPPQIEMVFAQKSHPGSTFKKQLLPGGAVVFVGRAAQRIRVEVGISPPKSALVRQTVAYTLSATGSADFSGAPAVGSAPNVVGVYASPNGHGIAKLMADGNIVCTDGQHGHWELFDAGSRVYTLNIGNDRWTLQFQPGRGFVDAQNGNITFQVK